MSVCVQGCEVKVATRRVSFLESIACLNTELRVFQPADDWFFDSWLRKKFVLARMVIK